MVRWAIELTEFDIRYESQRPIKGHVYANYIVVLTLKSSEASREDFLCDGKFMELFSESCEKWCGSYGCKCARSS